MDQRYRRYVKRLYDGGYTIVVKETGAKVAYAPMRTGDRKPWADADGNRYASADVGHDPRKGARR